MTHPELSRCRQTDTEPKISDELAEKIIQGVLLSGSVLDDWAKDESLGSIADTEPSTLFRMIGKALEDSSEDHEISSVTLCIAEIMLSLPAIVKSANLHKPSAPVPENVVAMTMLHNHSIKKLLSLTDGKGLSIKNLNDTADCIFAGDRSSVLGASLKMALEEMGSHIRGMWSERNLEKFWTLYGGDFTVATDEEDSKGVDLFLGIGNGKTVGANNKISPHVVESYGYAGSMYHVNAERCEKIEFTADIDEEQLGSELIPGFVVLVRDSSILIALEYGKLGGITPETLDSYDFESPEAVEKNRFTATNLKELLTLIIRNEDTRPELVYSDSHNTPSSAT